MEMAVKDAFSLQEGKPQFVRYADDFVVFHATEEGVKSEGPTSGTKAFRDKSEGNDGWEIGKQHTA